MLAKEIKRGSIVNYNDAPCLVESVSVQTPSARGASTFYKFRARNLITKQKVDITLRGGETLDEADFRRRQIKYMYADATHLHFLDQVDYNQYSLAKEDLAEESKYLTEELEGIQALEGMDEWAPILSCSSWRVVVFPVPALALIRRTLPFESSMAFCSSVGFTTRCWSPFLFNQARDYTAIISHFLSSSRTKPATSACSSSLGVR